MAAEALPQTKPSGRHCERISRATSALIAS
jgi:hypothetical protein